MAISAAHYCIVRLLYQQGKLPQGIAILELGEANWYGDAQPLELIEEIRQNVADPQRREALIERLTRAVEKREKSWAYDVAKVVYEMYFAPSEVQAIDLHGSPGAHHLDLNEPIRLPRRFGVVINHGTAEHIFNIAQVFITMHDHTAPGGLMIHEAPFTGWIDHGFYTVHPTLFYDVAQANGYEVVAMFIEDNAAGRVVQLEDFDAVYAAARANKIAENSMLFAVLAKGRQDQPFRFPMQGFYEHRLSDAGTKAWYEAR